MKAINLVCIIDDDPIYVWGAKKIMKMADFCKTTLEFEHGKNAINGFKKLLKSENEIPDIIFLDINMPVMDGWGFLDEYAKIESDLQSDIYIVSSSINPSDINRTKDYPFVKKYISKPMSKGALFDIKENFQKNLAEVV